MGSSSSNHQHQLRKIPLLSCNKRHCGNRCPQKNIDVSSPCQCLSRIFLIILSESSFKVISKNTVPQIYFQKLTPKCQHFVTFVGSTSWKSSEVIRSGEQNSWKAQIFSILFFGPQKLSQDLNDEPGMQWTFTFSTPEKSHLSNW